MDTLALNMALALHSECLSRLSEFVAQQLPKVRVDHRMFLDYASTSSFRLTDTILPKTGKVRDSLRRYIGESPLAIFLEESIGRDLFEANEYAAEAMAEPLTSFPSYSNPGEAAKRLIDDFESLPWTFVVSLELPTPLGRELRNLIGNFSLGRSLRLVSPDSSFDDLLPLQSGIEARDKHLFGGRTFLGGSLEKKRQWNQDSAYLQADVEGFIGRYQETSPLEEAVANLKSFFGLGIAVRLLRIGRKIEGLAALYGFPIKRWLIVHRRQDDRSQICITPELPSELSEPLNHLEIDDIDGKLQHPHIGGWVRNWLMAISTAFERREQARRVLLASQWLLDSYAGTNELLSFVQATVAMEILLGEETQTDIIGIGELLRNRCAYLIGHTRSQREQILKDFASIYDVRSKIVHRGKSKLNSAEHFLFRKLRWMCGRVIQEELELITEDKTAGT